jgi:hydroxypyruvate isomerase
MNRRNFVRSGAASAAAVALGCARASAEPGTSASGALAPSPAQTYKHSVTRWPFSKFSVTELARNAKAMGIVSVELLEPEEFALAKAEGMGCAIGYAKAGDPATRLTKGWNREAHHAWLLPGYEEGIRLAAAAGVPQVICFSGNREGLDDKSGLEASAAGLRQLMPAAERAGVTVIMELFNSKVNHPDYMADSTRWGVDLVQKVGSPRFKLLYDIYHMQIMEGDVIATIKREHESIAHYHTAGVPGRHEIDDSQELNYRGIVRALAEIGFTGYIAQEFIPLRDPMTSLREAVRICSV